MSDNSRRDPLEHLIVRVPSLAPLLTRAVRRIPPRSRLRRRIIELQLKRAFAAMARSDVEVVALFYEPHAEVEMQGMTAVGVDETYRGHEGVRAVYANVDEVFADWRWTIRTVVDGGDRLAIRADFRGLGRGSGAETVLTGGGTAIRLSERGLAVWQAWYPEQDGWEKALAAVGLSEL